MQTRRAKGMGEAVREQKLQLTRARLAHFVPRRDIRIQMAGMAHDEVTGAGTHEIAGEIAPIVAPQIEGGKARKTLIGVKTQPMRRIGEASPQ